MKKFSRFLTVCIAVVMLLTGCVWGNEATKSTNNTNTTTSKRGGLIPLTRDYVTKRGDTLTFTNEQIKGLFLYFQIDGSLTGQLFNENLAVIDGKGYVIDAKLDSLRRILSSTPWKVSNLQADPTDESLTLYLVTLDDRYECSVKESYDQMFYTKPEVTLNWNGKKYSVTIDRIRMIYKMVDPTKKKRK